MRSHAYFLIKTHYGDRTAERSGVPLINHIDEGLCVLRHLGADRHVREAFCIHPLVQADPDLRQNVGKLRSVRGDVVALAMEYRQRANASLSNRVELEYGAARWVGSPPALSTLPGVNLMLIADKVQNRADFELYHKGTHPRSAELDLYFWTWLNFLGVSEDTYRSLVSIMKEKKHGE